MSSQTTLHKYSSEAAHHVAIFALRTHTTTAVSLGKYLPFHANISSNDGTAREHLQPSRHYITSPKRETQHASTAERRQTMAARILESHTVPRRCRFLPNAEDLGINAIGNGNITIRVYAFAEVGL